jgi:hypothetical protein
LIKIKFEQNVINRTRLLKRLRNIQEEEKEDVNYILEILFLLKTLLLLKTLSKYF